MLLGHTIGSSGMFTTSSINVDLQCNFHFDKNDWMCPSGKGGYSCIKVFKDDDTSYGGYLVLPSYKVALDLKNECTAYIESWNLLHGVSPMFQMENSHRISIVSYVKKNVMFQ